ncbi:MAG: hypothetical protein ACTHK3_08405 [Solirubrobacterales bacterium]
MNPIRHFHPIRYLRRNLVAYLALFAALGAGTAYAAGKITGKDIAPNAIRTMHIKDGQVRGAELAAAAVTGDKVATTPSPAPTSTSRPCSCRLRPRRPRPRAQANRT